MEQPGKDLRFVFPSLESILKVVGAITAWVGVFLVLLKALGGLRKSSWLDAASGQGFRVVLIFGGALT